MKLVTFNVVSHTTEIAQEEHINPVSIVSVSPATFPVRAGKGSPPEPHTGAKIQMDVGPVLNVKETAEAVLAALDDVE